MIYNLKDIHSDSTAIFGGKAAALGRLAQNKVNIPEGYVLSTEAFIAYLEYNKFPYSLNMYLSHNDEIRKFLMEGKFPFVIQTKLADIYNELTDYGAYSIAIRSSAICEDDANHSMAGVFESFVDVRSYEEFEHSIRKCYASLFSDKALAMMLRSSIKLDNAGMGVVVQRFIKGNVSGVMFTDDAINMDDGIVVINVIKGVCSDFVDGTGKSSYYRVNKYNGQVIDSNVSQDTPELSGKDLITLAAAAGGIEKLFGCCQDVEWTICDGELYILQSRPITAFKANDTGISWSIPDEDSEKTWNLSYTDPIYPLTEELLLIYNEGITEGMLESGKGGGNFTKILNGYAYNYMAPRNPEKRKAFREKLDKMNSDGENIFQDMVLPQLLEHRSELSMYINKPLQANELSQYIKKSLEFFQKAIYLHILAVDGSMYLDDFKKYCTNIIPGITENDFYDLVFRKSALAVERERMLEIAQYVKSEGILNSLFDALPFDEILFAHLVRYETGVRLLQVINDYLKDYGLISLKGYGHITPEVIQEKPWEVLGKIRACMGMNRDNYNESINAIYQNKKRILAQITERLDEDERTNFLRKLMVAEKSFLVNDDHCFYIDLTSQGYLRLGLMKAGVILAERIVIKEPDDIYFLNLDEIFTSLEGEACDLTLRVRERKEAYDRYKKLIPPEYLGEVPENGSMIDSIDMESTVLKGVSGLGKKVSGRVKLMNGNIKSYDIKSDSILVLQHGHGCYFLPVMDKIKGLIYDEGSPFDHPGILAREFGIPSIYKTGKATKVLKDGDLVELDGISGVVRVIRRAV